MRTNVKLLLIAIALICISFSVIACQDADLKKAYSVTLPTETVGYTVTGESEVFSGQDYTFTVTIAEGYKKGADFAVKVNGEEVALLANGSATVKNVLCDLVVTVDGVETMGYKVNLVAGTGYTLTGEEFAAHGVTYNFGIELAEGYEEAADFAVMVNGLVVDANADGSYSVANVEAAITVTVKGLKLKEYDITYTSGTGVTVSGPAKVTHGESATFTLTFADGYEAGANFAVKVNGESQEVAGNTVTVSNVKGALAVVADGAELMGYTATLNAGTGYTLTGADRVLYGETYTFNFALVEGYEKAEGFAVKVNGAEVELAADGSYTVASVKANISVEVVGVQRISFAATLNAGTGYTLTGASSVYYGDNHTLTFAFAEGYEASDDFVVLVNGEEVELAADGTYTISNVKGAIVVEVEGVKLCPETQLGKGENENADQWWK